MDKPFIKLSQLFEIDNLYVNLLPKKLTFPYKIQKIIDEYWTEEKQKSYHLFNGKIYLLQQYEVFGKNLKLSLIETDFKTYLGINLNPYFKKSKYHINALGLNILIKTKDSFFILGKRSEQVAEMKNMWHCIGGNLDSLNPVENVYKELWEEVNINKNHIKPEKVVNNTITKRDELLFLTKINLTKEETNTLLQTAIDKNEHSKIAFFDKENLFLMQNRSNVTLGTQGLIKVYFQLLKEKKL